MKELAKTYSPEETEKKQTKNWEDAEIFKADPSSHKPSFSIVMPPPNVTGILHMGHSLVTVLQDILIRFKRMKGFETLWVPGTDHAGIATQTVVEKALLKSEGKHRRDYDREEFINRIWQWKEKSEQVIVEQLKKMGCSADFSRFRFTMDPTANLAVREEFKRLYDQGYIYQGDYLINFDPLTETALSDDEVEYEDRVGHLYYFKYHLKDDAGYLTIATTRPETMLGDTAIAVSPKDERYRHLIGKSVHLPIINRIIPIIADHHVDPTFGTGVVKVTPAHDPNDYRMGLEHNLKMINIFTTNGRINENGAPFTGLSIQEAREAVIQEMQRLNLLEKVEKIHHRVSISYRSKAVIEPLLSKQWFLKMEPFKKRLKELVETEEVKLIPESWKHTYYHWIHNLRDWCISRQLWWGHRIPVWHHKITKEKICFSGEGLPEQVQKEPELWVQDPDVLDTWFSSALWPLSTMGWPNIGDDFTKFFPTSVLVTGHDILFFWVARMMIMSEHICQKPPFENVFLHGLIFGRSYWRKDANGVVHYVSQEEKKSYDLGQPLPKDVESKWEKLSKSKGNVIDPLEMIQDYGTDALRMALCSIANQSPQIDLDRRVFEEHKNFANKIWNAARFICMNLVTLEKEELSQGLDNNLLLEDKWLLSQMNRLAHAVSIAIDGFRFEQAAYLVYDFFWNKFCAFYLEIAKPHLFEKITLESKKNKQKLLLIALGSLLRLLHPMAPFITEELFQILHEHFGDISPKKDADPYTKECLEALSSAFCAIASYPICLDSKDIKDAVEKEFDLIQSIVNSCRNLRQEANIALHENVDLYLMGADHLEAKNILEAQLKLKNLYFVTTPPQLNEFASKNIENIKIWIPLSKEHSEKEMIRLQKELEKHLILREKLVQQLSNEQFIEKAAKELVQKQKATLCQVEETIATITSRLKK